MAGMTWIMLTEIQDVSDPDNIRTEPVVVKVDSINSLKRGLYVNGAYYGTAVNLQNDVIFVTESIDTIVDRTTGLMDDVWEKLRG